MTRQGLGQGLGKGSKGVTTVKVCRVGRRPYPCALGNRRGRKNTHFFLATLIPLPLNLHGDLISRRSFLIQGGQRGRVRKDVFIGFMQQPPGRFIGYFGSLATRMMLMMMVVVVGTFQPIVNFMNGTLGPDQRIMRAVR